MKKLKLLLIFLLLKGLMFSQATYPRLQLTDKGDTICLITIPQLDSINVTYIRLEGAYELIDTLQSQIYQHQLGYSNLKHQSRLQAEKIAVMDSIDVEQTKQINMQNEVIRKGTRKNKWLKLQRNALGVAVLVAVAKIFIIR